MFSCDTFVVTQPYTEDGRIIVAKNSDREPNEPNNVVFVPATRHTSPAVQCTYIQIPQVKYTPDLLLLQPSWIWGAEYGSNSYGVCIGNEAVFSKFPAPRVPALLGMDLLRLGLERGKTAAEAREVIIQLLEEHGQGGNCGLSRATYYNNSFLIADRREAFILETYEKIWVWKRVKGLGVISNCYTIEENWDSASPDLFPFARSKGITKERFSFSKLFSDFTYTTFGSGNARKCAVTAMLGDKKGSINVEYCMRVLRMHHKADLMDFNPSGLREIGKQSVCMHYGGYIRRAQTTGSCISHLALPNPKDENLVEDSILDTHWVTNTSSPCISIFKPVIGVDSLPCELNRDRDNNSNQFFSPSSFWWMGEELHRLTLLDYTNRAPLLRARGHLLEVEALGEVARLSDRPQKLIDIDKMRKALVLKYYLQSKELMKELIQLFNEKQTNKSWRLGTSFALWYYWNWKRLNDKSFLPIKSFWPRIFPLDILAFAIIGAGAFLFFPKRKR